MRDHTCHTKKKHLFSIAMLSNNRYNKVHTKDTKEQAMYQDLDICLNQIINLRDNGYGCIEDCVSCICQGFTDEFINRVWRGLEEEYGIY